MRHRLGLSTGTSTHSRVGTYDKVGQVYPTEVSLGIQARRALEQDWGVPLQRVREFYVKSWDCWSSQCG